VGDDGPETPIGPRWWPSEWGPSDQRGAANRLTPAHVKEAAGLIREGKENLDLEAPARDEVREFAFIFAPLRLKGATGSPGNPIAVR
jgi:hypothetical protein